MAHSGPRGVYLRDRLEKVRQKAGKGKFQTFYRVFLLKLFHEGFSKQPPNRELTKELTVLLGKVPYLNGGLFDVHELETRYESIDVPDEAFENLFGFFDNWEWHLDSRPLATGREINPDVLGYIFEQFINKKQMGAYYTKEDVTDYISKNTIIPHLFDVAQKGCAVAFQAGSALWRLLADNPDRYLYPAVRRGVIDEQGEVVPLPADVEVGVTDVSRRTGWNRPALAPFNLPTETWREHVARRQRCLELRALLLGGKVTQINDLITANLDVRQFAADAIAGCEGPELLRAFYQAIANVSVLDPTCGSGAFLFAALNVLKPLYEACLDRMEAFVEDLDRSGEARSPKKFEDFRRTLAEVARHPNRDYFILKSIVVRNLYGVDLMREAVEICKLRLFLKLVAQIQRVQDLEPLPDVDFNIRPGNTLVGFATLDDVKQSLFKKHDKKNVMRSLLDSDEEATVTRISESAEVVARVFTQFHRQQTEFETDARSFASTKKDLRARLDKLAEELDRYLAVEYAVDPDKPRKFAEWRDSHQPFHWFAEFFGIMSRGGFDVIVGNPPYVEYAKVRGQYTIRGFQTGDCGNLYVFVVERCHALARPGGRYGLIVPLSFVCTERMSAGRALLQEGTVWLSCFDIRPSSLFEGISQRLAIVLQDLTSNSKPTVYSGGYRRWSLPERTHLMSVTCFVAISSRDRNGPISKIFNQIEHCILEKISGPLISSLTLESAKAIYVHRICRYFIKAVDFVPYFKDADGKKGKSEDYKPFTFHPDIREPILCFINSSLFYWFWRAYGDGFHCGYGDVYRAPLSPSLQSPDANFSAIAERLMTALNENSTKKTIRTAKGEIVYQEFSPKPTKPVLDEIDELLGSKCAFSPEELDFILNYDVKYRMGQEEAEDEE